MKNRIILNGPEQYSPESAPDMRPSIDSATPRELAEIMQILGYWKRDESGTQLVEDIQADIERVRHAMDPANDEVYLVEKLPDHTVIGLMGLIEIKDGEFHDPKAKTGELTTAYIHPMHTKEGIGTRLADALEQIAKAAGYESLVIVSGSRNRDGYPFWTKRYGQGQVEPDFFGPGHERVVWHHNL